ncbi:NO-inducible flavohemoprotein [Granulibacter bethesdensis]|uniref:nitric oxide dioxygenase n=1 Tax=Granulibacter bethesdensis (strain ATCC BAA-1260 / CGDNIH1) TaxID=391165 RepID=Q0BRI0_GRABC|nr:NO-inducible flavohemoprotein [Granulibacter bethesdensis]ABI62572.1 Flavohemoprotein [Granulibacter bethesdensis CGDNIH1]APH52424.1 Flavohemoprotein [Granulibacter bethesdensis]APH65114.1 Flavohemoprotein [Granulibacter bethesdensis]
MPSPLGDATTALIKATIPALAEYGIAITRAMYARLFQNREIAALFNQSNQSNGMQPEALAGAILAYARNIDTLEVLGPAVERIAEKHVGAHILPEHYHFVAEALLGAISDVLGDAATPEILDAWGEAYWFLANVLIEREKDLREAAARAEGGWTGWRPFIIADKIRESEFITSFILRPTDGGPVLRHRPGQYLTVTLSPAGAPPLKRNYTISCAPNGKYYRLSVKREASGGGASAFLHDQMKVGDTLLATPPAGDFVLPENQTRPVILVSAGVGLTPMVSMAESLAARHCPVPVHFIHCTQNSKTHAMGTALNALAEKHKDRMTVTTFYSRPLATDEQGVAYDQKGRMTAQWLMAWLSTHMPLMDADLYVCGPRQFLHDMLTGLDAAGVPAERVHHELFGPTISLQAA